MGQKKASKWLVFVIIIVIIALLGQCSNNGNSSSSKSSGGKTAICNNCHGTGFKNGSTCVWCGGSGRTYDNKFNDYLR